MTHFRRRMLSTCTALLVCGQSVTPVFAATSLENDAKVRSPIKHVIVIVGENRTFDHLFATYQPKPPATIRNLLSRGIIDAGGAPGPHFADFAQKLASDRDTFDINPKITGAYDRLPPPNTGFTHTTASDTAPPPFKTVAAARAFDYGVLPGDARLLTTGASGLPILSVDTRIKDAKNLPNGPFRLSPGVAYDDYANSPVHRFYQMWQQVDCKVSHATPDNPSGCAMDLFPWVEVTVGAGADGKPRPADFNAETTGEGATAMGYYDMTNGDAVYLRQLARQYTMSDNYHQPVMGGTGANSIMLGTGDLIWYSDGKGNPKKPPENQIENPDPQPGTNNWYTQDGYSGGSYSACANPDHPGVGSVVAYLKSLPYQPKPSCQPGHYYLLNNYSPGYFGNGKVDTAGTFTIPPSSTPTIADVLLSHKVSWRYYGEGWNAYVQNPSSPFNVYCTICNPFQYETAIMTNDLVRANNLRDTTDLYNDITQAELPAVSFVKPGGLNDGHPVTSKFNIFEAYVKKILTQLQAKPVLWNSTAVLITVDEGGGYFDSGYIQPLDFFGDGTRIPLIVVSPYALGGHVTHSYTDHVSILKFIEKNWNLPPITARSRDNLPNPIATAANPYVPTNSPAIGDLTDMFHF